MIAEDSDSVRYALRLALEYLGHEVVGQAADGEEAVTIFLQQHPQLVVMDVRMPVMDGLTSTTLLRQFDPQTRVVIVTAGRTTESQARAAGADAFVEKPFDISSLGRVIDHLATAA
jgi:CheY-like chemotaxis protein